MTTPLRARVASPGAGNVGYGGLDVGATVVAADPDEITDVVVGELDGVDAGGTHQVITPTTVPEFPEAETTRVASGDATSTPAPVTVIRTRSARCFMS